MLLIRFSLALLGCVMALLFQAWALPFYILIVIVLTLFFLPHDFSDGGDDTIFRSNVTVHNQTKVDSWGGASAFSKSCFKLFAFSFVAILFLAGTEEATQDLLILWDKLSFYDLKMSSARPALQYTIGPSSAKFLMNMTALLIPINIGVHYSSILRFTYRRRTLHVFVYMVGVLVFLSMSFLPLLTLEGIYPGNKYAHQLVFYVYFFQVPFVYLFLKFKPRIK